MNPRRTGEAEGREIKCVEKSGKEAEENVDESLILMSSHERQKEKFLDCCIHTKRFSLEYCYVKRSQNSK